jgi:hypothetical protein
VKVHNLPTGHCLTDVLEVHFLELPRLREAIAAGTPDHPLMQWILFIDCESPEVFKMFAQDNKDIRIGASGPEAWSGDDRSLQNQALLFLQDAARHGNHVAHDRPNSTPGCLFDP